MYGGAYMDPKGQGVWWYCHNLDRTIMPGLGNPADNINFQTIVCEVRVRVNGGAGRREYVVRVALSASLHVADDYAD